MATQEVSILNDIHFDTAGDTWLEPYDVLATNDVWRHIVICLGLNLTSGFYGQFTVPQSYVSVPALALVLSTTATYDGGVFRFAFLYRTVGGDNTTSLDQGTPEQTLTFAPQPGSVAHNRLYPVTSLSGSFAAGETIEYYFVRDMNMVFSASPDGVPAAAYLHDLLFQFSDT